MNTIVTTFLIIAVNATVVNAINVSVVFAYDTALKDHDQETRQAISYYQRGEVLYNNSNFELALDLFRKAIKIHKSDGRLVIDENIIIKSKSYGRFVKKTSTTNIQREDYYPNSRINEIQTLLRDKKRRADPPTLELTWLTIQEPTNDNVLDGGETASLVLNIENTGNTIAIGVLLETIINDSTGLTFEKHVIVGDIEAKQSTTASINISGKRNIVDKNRIISIIAKDKGGFDSEVIEVLLQTRPHQSPDIVLSNIKINDLNSDAKIEPTETITITANIINKGAGVSYPLIANLELGENVFPGPDNKNSIQLDKLYPGESHDISFSFLTNHRFNHNQSIPASIKIINSKNTLVAKKHLGVSIYSPQNKMRVNIKPIKRRFEYGNQSNLIDIDINIPQGRTKNKNAVAVIIGNKSYLIPGLPQVDYAINDAKIMKKYLIKTLGFNESNIIYIENATAARFNETFGNYNNFSGKLFDFVMPGVSDVFIYYSGHGAPDLNNKNAYFVPVDVDPRYINTSGYSLDLLYKNIAHIPAKSFTIVLDTCFSGNSDGGFLLGNISPATIQTKIKIPTLKNVTIFASTTRDQVSTWYHDKKHGLFTYFFLKGLSGYADNNNDSIITTTEVGDYLTKYVPYQARRINGHIQTPLLVQHRENILAHLSTPIKELVYAPCCQ